jgi:amidase
MNHRTAFGRTLLAIVSLPSLCIGCAAVESVPIRASLATRSIAELRAELDAGRTTSVALVQTYLARIDDLDRKGPTLRAVLATNPDAVQQARELDRERAQGQVRGPLHGIPVLLKDNIETMDVMPTTAGSLALARNFASADAPIAAHLREAGAIILGKTNLSEWANFRSDRSISGWSAIGGLTKNPHVLDRSACGSSAGSGVAAAAGYAAGTVGTETDGSITCPASMNGVVGLKPTLGLLAQSGIVPISHSQDTAGPMARTVSDVAAILTAMVGPGPANCASLPGDCRKVDYSALLVAGALQGKRVGVWRFRAGRYPVVDATYEIALQVLRDAGAILIEVQVPENARIRMGEDLVLTTEFKSDLNAYLAQTPASVPVKTIDQLIRFNASTSRELVLFGQELMARSSTAKGLDDAAYKSALEDSKRLAGPEGISRLLSSERLDFIVAPTTGPSWRIDIVAGDQFSASFSTLPAVSGYPHLTVPMGSIQGLPVGLSFIGAPWTEGALLAAGYAFEQRAHAFQRPAFKATLEVEGEAALN